MTILITRSEFRGSGLGQDFLARDSNHITYIRQSRYDRTNLFC